MSKKFLVNRITLPAANIDPLDGNIENALDPKPNLGYQFEREVGEMAKNGYPSDHEAVLRSRCINFIRQLITQLRQRLPDNVKILQQMSQLSIKKALNAVGKLPLIPVMELMHVAPETIDIIENQWQSLTLVSWCEKKGTVAFWSEVYAHRDASDANPFQELSEFAISILVLPHSNAEVERVFSQMNIVKNKLRNRMETEMANAILAVRAGLKRHGKLCYEYDIPKEVAIKIGTSVTYGGKGPSVSTSSANGGSVPSTSQDISAPGTSRNISAPSTFMDTSVSSSSQDTLFSRITPEDEMEDDLSLFLLI